MGAHFSFAQQKDSTLVVLENKVEKAPTDSLKVEALLQLGVYQLRKDFNVVETYMKEVTAILDTPNVFYDVRRQKAEVFQQLGILNRKRARYTKALQYYLDAQKIFLELNDTLNLSSNYHNVAVVFRFQKEYRKSVETFKKAIRINEKNGIPKKIGDNYIGIGISYKSMNQIDSAYYYYDKANEKFKLAGHENGINTVKLGKAVLLKSQKKYAEALPLLLEYLDYTKKKGMKATTGSTHFNLAGIYNGLQQFSKALFHIDQCIIIAKKELMGQRLAAAYKRKSRIYYMMKQYEPALTYYRKYSKANDSVFSVAKAKEIREIELRHEFSQQKLKDSIQFTEERKVILAQAETQSVKKKLYLVLFVITLILSLIIGYYGIRYFKIRWKKARLAKEELDQLLTLSTQKNEERMRQVQSEIEVLEKEITHKREEVTKLMAESLQHIQSKERLVDDLKKIASNEEEISIQSIIADLKSEVLEDSRLTRIKNDLEEINYDFFKRLSAKHPNLTKTDLEICSYLKLSLGRREIARLRFTSLEAVKKSRSRLRKRMNLQEEENLVDYIKSI
ncbi:tetratricopeptide repeat protein [Aquimarina sp. 2201CG5-10]|nr:tetratricopeptide repeat protein [Aquimarina sp. 2201CG5-10]